MKVYSKKARKTYACGRCGNAISPGDQYYSWKPRFGGKRLRCSAHYPRQSELTSNDKLQTIYEAQEDIEDAIEGFREDPQEGDVEAFIQAVREAAEKVNEAVEAYTEGMDNVSGYFGESGPTYEALEEGYNAAEDFQTRLEQAADDMESEFENWQSDNEENPEDAEAWEAFVDNICGFIENEQFEL